LGSSRESARQGFAACLADVLKTITKIDLEYVLTMLDEHTKVTGSMKGQEERDMLFGQLFGYLAVLRSNRVNDTKMVSDLIDRLLLLHSKKGWIKEVTTEAILILISTIDRYSLTHLTTYSFTHLTTYSLTHLTTYSFTYLTTYSFTHLTIYSLTHLTT
jgi:DNA polymerase phi